MVSETGTTESRINSTITLAYKGTYWFLSYLENGKVITKPCDTIEIASSFLEDVFGVHDDDIDKALIYMATMEHSRAVFVEGVLEFTEP